MHTDASRMQAGHARSARWARGPCGLDPARAPRTIARMALPQNPIVKLVSRFAAKLRFPHLFLLTAGLFLLDLVIPDVIPFADELLLGLGTLLLGSLRRSKSGARDPESVSGSKRRT
jgi:hypothetical protein